MTERSQGVKPERFVSLRIKFVAFLSLIIIVTCSAISWYFINNKRDSMTQQLKNVGTILAKNLASNPRVRFAVITDDRETLAEFLDVVMGVDDVVYAIISDSDGHPLVARTKGRSTDARIRKREIQTTLYPDPGVGLATLQTTTLDPFVSYLVVEPGKSRAVPVDRLPSDMASKLTEQERMYDFALPVLRPAEYDIETDSLELQRAEASGGRRKGNSPASRVLGLIQVGLTESHLNVALIEAIGTAAWLTLAIILSGILGTIWLTNRIITPLRSLASVARRVTGGDLNATAPSTTNDEIGQLTWLFNNMTQSLKERDEAISTNLATISSQVRQLTTLNQAATALSSTLELDKLLRTVMRLLTDNLGFARTIVVFYDPETGRARVASVAGLAEAVQQTILQREFLVEEGTLHADLFVRGQSLLVTDIAHVAGRLPMGTLDLIRQSGTTSFVVAPLRSTQRILGYIGADRGQQACTQDDLDILVTLASHVAVAIDNAQAYHELGTLTASLEQRVEERTAEIQSANARLQELDKLKSAFVSIVSHELRTPMTAIRGYIDNMLDGLAGPLTEKQGHYLNRVKVNADRLTHMIAELLDLSRIEAGKVELSLSEVDLRTLAIDVLDEFQRMAQDKGVTVAMAAPETVPLFSGDRNKLHQVLTNLVGNALKFTPSEGRVEVSLSQPEPGILQVDVTDTGFGIPAEELPRIFEKFFRGHTVPPEARGAGLGLAIVRTLIELHGGRVWVESTVGAGSRFSFRLPLRPSPNAQAPGT
ncbi:hypothetical protein YTPLAS18_05270 [Nitrospira sp.]|nr:hypothetical protein YTPLAS18_05270 [Nitrospira sp.]